MKCLTSYIDKINRDHRSAHLFEQVPTIEFYPKFSQHHDGLKVLKSREKKVVTMDIGPFYAKETVLYNSDGALYHSRQLRSLVPYRCTYGYDVLVYVGRALFLHCRTEHQIIEELRRKNISISPREIGYSIRG